MQELAKKYGNNNDQENYNYEEDYNYDHHLIKIKDLKPNEIAPLHWYVTSNDPNDTENKIVTPYALQIGLPQNLQSILLKYCQDNGIIQTFHDLLYENPIDVGANEIRKINNKDWFIQRTDERWNSNMHWISPADKITQDDYLNMLMNAPENDSFYQVLNAIGNKLDMDGLVAYHLTFIGVSKCDKGYLHNDFEDVDGKAFNIIIPIITVDDGPEELYIQDDVYPQYISSYKYKLNECIAIGDSAYHATAPCDYTSEEKMRIAATIYVADVNEDNVDNIMAYYTQYYPPNADKEFLLNISGMHWKKKGVEYVRKQQ